MLLVQPGDRMHTATTMLLSSETYMLMVNQRTLSLFFGARLIHKIMRMISFGHITKRLKVLVIW